MTTATPRVLILFAVLLVGAVAAVWLATTPRDQDSQGTTSTDTGSIPSVEPALPEALPTSDAEAPRVEIPVADESAEEETAASQLLAKSIIWCRLIDAGDERPIEGAVVTARASEWPGFGPRSAFEPAESKSDGLVELHVSSWMGATARVEAAGYGPAMFKTTEGHETQELALEIRLAPSAELVIRLVDVTSSPLVSASIELSAPTHSLMRLEATPADDEAVVWSGVVGEDGQGAALARESCNPGVFERYTSSCTGSGRLVSVARRSALPSFTPQLWRVFR